MPIGSGILASAMVPLVGPLPRIREDDPVLASPGLRAYLRYEHHADLNWLLAALRERGPSLGARLRAWLAARPGRADETRSAGSAGESPESTKRPLGIEDRRSEETVATSSGDAVSTPSPRGCDHAERIVLGSGGNAFYFQCQACHGVIVTRGGRM